MHEMQAPPAPQTADMADIIIFLCVLFPAALFLFPIYIYMPIRDARDEVAFFAFVCSILHYVQLQPKADVMLAARCSRAATNDVSRAK